MKSKRLGRVVALAATLTVAIGASAAKAEPAKWDQKRVTAIAQQLAVAVGDLRENVRKQPTAPNSPSRKVRFQALDDLRTLQQSCANLARDLKAGKSREETYPLFQRIQMLRRDAEEHARRADIRQDTLDRIVKAQDLLRQLSPYYEEEAKEVEGAAPAAAPGSSSPAPAQ